jgi:flagellar hook protein FlgE
MSLSSVFSTAISGLSAAETTIDVTGNNVANANTVGFKQSQAEFSTQFLQNLSLGSAPNADNGGTDPTQIGLGVQVSAITPDFKQGNLQISSSPSDLAVQGDGFFIVQGTGGQQLYTRDGNFTPNSLNQLTTSTGQTLMGFGVDNNFNVQTTQLVPLTIPLGSTAVAKATQNVQMQGTLTPTGDLATTGAIVQSGQLGDASKTSPAGATPPQLAPVPDTVGAGTTATGAAGGSLTAGGTYTYKIVFADGPVGSVTNTESLPSQTLGPITLGAGQQTIDLNNLPVDSTGAYKERRIYRTAAGGTSYQLVGEIPDNTTTTYTDTTADTSLGQMLNTDSLSGNYSYYVTYANAIGGPGTGVESRPTPLLGPINVVSGRVQLENLPVDASGQWTVRRIYRNSAANPSQFNFVAEIPNMTGGESYTDSTPDSVVTTRPQVNLNGPPVTSSTLLTNVLQYSAGTYDNLFQVGSLSFAGSLGGLQQTPKTFNVTAASTVGDLANFMDQALGIQSPPGADSGNPIPNDSSGLPPGVSITSDGRLQFVSNAGLDNAVSIGLSALQSTTGAGTQAVPLNFSQTQAAVGQSTTADFIAYDSLGIPINVHVTAVLQSRTSTLTTYRWFADSPQNDPTSGSTAAVGTGLINFDGEGKFVSASNSTVSVDRAHVPSAKPLQFNLDFTQLSGLAATAPTLSATSQDGFPPGKLTSYVVGQDGIIKGSFDNGTQRNLGQIRLARFANSAGLQQVGQNLYTPGVNSGLPVDGNPNQEGIGSLVAGALEQSNTDVGQNLISLITASTQYRGNAQVISTAQTLFDTLLQLRTS